MVQVRLLVEQHRAVRRAAASAITATGGVQTAANGEAVPVTTSLAAGP
jgi:hypothetical protein